ncbi:EamA family transporter RarD [Mesocricetibacter intestinalis]|uniref:EamA family transporter RarD n=1 Tax=Mesocricetibacter intestinalis TaxID=1521930 RepID=UPI00105D40F6|nr:EamA family transporter RarD [Mesocricetibacter intestinalis]
MIKGIGFSLFASMLFGFLYYFSTLLKPLSGQDIFGFRILFTVPFLLAAIFLFKQKHAFIILYQRIRQTPWYLAVICFNGSIMGLEMWLFLWAPNNGSSVSTSLGYLLMPLCLVLSGKLIFKEQISRLKFIAILTAALGVGMNIVIKGGLSWESLVVCGGYSLYFIIRKKLQLTDFACFTLEMLCTLPVAIYFAMQQDLSLVQQLNPNILYYLLILGLVSGIALISYVTASNLLPINLLGLLGYAEPILMLIVSLIIGEHIGHDSYPLLSCLFAAMLLLILDGFLYVRKQIKHLH